MEASLSSLSPDENYAIGQEIAKSLPDNIQAILKRKSSRDPNSRFIRKLHVLLSYSDASGPEMAERMGIGWIDDQIFHMYKPRLLGVMGLKLNSLNVNLRDLKFIQLQPDKRHQGWTTWRKDGFNKRSFANPTPYTDENDIFQQPVGKLEQDKVEFEIGKIIEQDLDLLQQMILQEWQLLTESPALASCAASYFIGRAANRYRAEKQSFQNAFDVLKAILAPLDVSEIKFSDFFRFMAMFGPPGDSVMLKIHSLLEVATQDVPWLYFGLTPSLDEPGVYGYFDNNEPNALIFHQGQTIDKVWNLPLVPSQDGCQYIEDSQGKKYGSWQEYFQDHPITYAQTFEVGDIGAFH